MAAMLHAHQAFSCLITFLFFSCLPLSTSQNTPVSPVPTASQPALAPAPPPPYAFAQECNRSVAIRYQIDTITKSYPVLQDPKKQPYVFTAQAELVNHGDEEVKGWQMYIGFQNNEILVSAEGAVLADGSPFPSSVGNGTIISSVSQPDLKTAIETAMDITQMAVTIPITGTEFGVAPPPYPMPTNISLIGFKCDPIRIRTNVMETCCIKNKTEEDASLGVGLPLEKGDITILYDVLQTYDDNYFAKVTISNDNPLGRLDFWNLGWDWQFGEFIYEMKGAETTEQDQSLCVNGVAGTWYKEIDFSQVMNCQPSPTIIDLDQYKVNDSLVGRIPFCCRNGTLLPANIDATKSKSVFQLKVYKVPPHNKDRTDISPPINWRINGSFDAGYVCGQPRLVAPSEFPDPASSVRTESAVMTWQVTCNITDSPKILPRCCVSFSAFYNESAVPCPTCACGCQSKSQSNCDRKAEGMLLPFEVLPVPFVNRTEKVLEWAKLKDHNIPNPLPCPDNCGVSINWHVNSDFTNGWSARITLFNWSPTQFADWFAAVQMGNTFPGFEKVYSFNGTTDVPGMNKTILMRGLPTFNYLNPIFDGHPGLQQSVLSFTKKGIRPGTLVARDFFPQKVFFDGDECALPSVIPSAGPEIVRQALLPLIVPLLLLILGPFGLL